MPLTALVERGFAIASLDFSPASAAPFPGQVHEIKAAVRFLRSQAATLRLRRDANRHSRRVLGRPPRGARRRDERSSRARGHARRPSRHVVGRAGDRVVLRRLEPHDDPQAIDAVRPQHPRAVGEDPARCRARRERGRRAARKPRVSSRCVGSAVAAAARRPRSADADQPVARARRAPTTSAGSTRRSWSCTEPCTAAISSTMQRRTEIVAAFLDEHLRRELTSDSAQR